MKVLFVALGIRIGVGGMERFNQRVERALDELSPAGVDHWTVALWDRPASGGKPGGGGRYRACNASKVRAAAGFLVEAARRQPDVILYGHVLLAPLAVAAQVLSPRSRNVLFVHGHEVWVEPFRRRVPWRDRLVVRGCIDEVTAVSRLTAGRMAAGYRLPASRFRLLPNAVDPPAAAPLPRNGAGGPPRLLTVARLSEKDRYKGCDRVLRALPRVLAEVPGARYDIVGDGPLRRELEELAGQLGVRRAVRFLGYVDDGRLEEIYRRASVLVMPSTGEGFGIVFLEAWKHGLPVVAGNRDASSEVVADGETGLCVDPESPDQIGRAVVRLLNDPAYAARLGMQGYQTLLERYTHQTFRDNLWEILRNPAPRGGGRGGEKAP